MPRHTTRSIDIRTNYDDVIRPVAATPKLQRHIANLAEHLRKTHAHALGFLPDQTYAKAIERDRLVCTLENGEPCGILLWGKRRDRIKIHQTVIAPDSRRLLHATHAVHTILEHPDCRTAATLQLRCALDLEAIDFWKAIGMRHIYTVEGKLWPGRKIAIMKLKLLQTKARKKKMIDNLIDLAIKRGRL